MIFFHPHKKYFQADAFWSLGPVNVGEAQEGKYAIYNQ